MDTTINRSTHTRRIVAAMRSISRGYQGSAYRGGFMLNVVLDRSFNGRVYRLEHTSQTRAGCFVIVDVLKRECWIAPVRDDDRAPDRMWHDVMVHTLLVDHLVGLLASAGYTFLPGSSGA